MSAHDPQANLPNLSEANIRYIFGLKLRQYRRVRRLSLKDLAAATGISASYLNEIEKGKKFPKPNKSMDLAKALQVSYDDLHSLQLKGNLAPLTRFLTHPFFQRFPLEQFGLSPSSLLESMSLHPIRFATLINTLVRIARRYDLDHEALGRAALRSHIELHDNYFANLERAADQYRKAQGWEPGQTPRWEELADILARDHGCHVDCETIGKDPALASTRELRKPGNPGVLYLNPALDGPRRAFHICREIGFQVLKLNREARLKETHPGSFAPPFEEHYSSYFAGCLLIDRKPFLREIKAAFTSKNLQPALLTNWLEQYQVSPGTLLSRFSQLFPRHLGLTDLFLTRIDRCHKKLFVVSKELHFSRLHATKAWGSAEHYCRRWTPIRLMNELSSHPEVAPLGRIERLNFLDTDTEYFVCSIAYPTPLKPGRYSCATIGLVMDTKLKRVSRFWNDAKIERTIVGDTCERCPIPDCQERVAEPTIIIENERRRATDEARQRLLS